MDLMSLAIGTKSLKGCVNDRPSVLIPKKCCVEWQPQTNNFLYSLSQLYIQLVVGRDLGNVALKERIQTEDSGVV